MLSGMRTAAGNWLGRLVISVLFGILIISFGVWGIADIFRGYGSSTVAKVGGTEIGVETVRRAYLDQMQRLSQQARRAITNDQARAFGLDRQVLQRLISETVLDDEARRLGLSVSSETVARSLLDEPAFRGSDGRFSRELFNEYLRQIGFAEAAFLRQQAGTLARQEIVEGLAGGTSAPAVWLEAAHRFRTEERSIAYVTLPVGSVGDIADPDEATAKAYFEAHKAQYQAPEYRKLTTLVLLPLDFASEVKVSDEELRQTYDAAAAAGRFGAPEKREIQQIVFPNDADAQAAAQKISEGASFEDVVKERNLGDADITLGSKTRAELFDPAIADAAFALPEGGTSKAVAGRFGAVILHIAKIIPSEVKPFDEVKDSLRPEVAAKKLASDKAVRDKLAELRDKVEDQRASGKALADIAKDLNLKILSYDAVDQAGRDKSGTASVTLPDQAEVMKAAFASDVGLDNDPIRTRDGGYVWFEVNGVERPRQRGFDEVKAEVSSAWKTQEAATRLTARSAELLKELRGGATLQDLAWKNGEPLEEAKGLTRSNPGAVGQGVATAAFATRLDDFNDATAADGTGRTIFQLKEIKVPPRDPKDTGEAQLRQQVSTALVDDLIGAYIQDAQRRLGVTINERAFRMATTGSDTEQQ